MKSVLLIGLDPAVVDFSDPALPPGLNAEKIHAGVKAVVAEMTARGWLGENCYILGDQTSIPAVESRLRANSYDCVVIGAGVRLPPQRLLLMEAIINAVRRMSPHTAIAFNTRPQDSAEAAARWI
ncbi:MAG: hypothetical protein ACLQHF_11580 [Terracidiphilus sp.]